MILIIQKKVKSTFRRNFGNTSIKSSILLHYMSKLFLILEEAYIFVAKIKYTSNYFLYFENSEFFSIEKW